MSEQEVTEDKKINAARVADIWNKRAKDEKNIDGRYTRFSVRNRRQELGGEETAIGWLYSEQKAWSIPLRPHSTGRPDRVEANRTPFRKKDKVSEDSK